MSYERPTDLNPRRDVWWNQKRRFALGASDERPWTSNAPGARYARTERAEKIAVKDETVEKMTSWFPSRSREPQPPRFQSAEVFIAKLAAEAPDLDTDPRTAGFRSIGFTTGETTRMFNRPEPRRKRFVFEGELTEREARNMVSALAGEGQRFRVWTDEELAAQPHPDLASAVETEQAKRLVWLAELTEALTLYRAAMARTGMDGTMLDHATLMMQQRLMSQGGPGGGMMISFG